MGIFFKKIGFDGNIAMPIFFQNIPGGGRQMQRIQWMIELEIKCFGFAVFLD